MPRLAPPLLALCLAACAAHTPRPLTPSAGRGTLYIVGGGGQSPEMLAHFVALAGGPGRARIAVVPMASEAAAEGGAEKAAELRAIGAETFVINVTAAEAATDSIVRQLGTATGVWFGGGDQVRLAAALAGTPALAAIRARYLAGAVVGGTSAGAAVMSDSMLTGDQVRAGEDTSGYFGDEFPRIARGAIVVRPGFGFVSGAIIDQHFVRRERHNRLIAAVLERPALLGVGIDEGTALRVDPDGRWTVEGASAVVIYDARSAVITPAGAPRLGATGVRMQLLPTGSTYDPASGRATLPAP